MEREETVLLLTLVAGPGELLLYWDGSALTGFVSASKDPDVSHSERVPASRHSGFCLREPPAWEREFISDNMSTQWTDRKQELRWVGCGWPEKGRFPRTRNNTGRRCLGASIEVMKDLQKEQLALYTFEAQTAWKPAYIALVICMMFVPKVNVQGKNNYMSVMPCIAFYLLISFPFFSSLLSWN